MEKPRRQPGLSRCAMLVEIAKEIQAGKEPFDKLTTQDKNKGLEAIRSLLRYQDCKNIPDIPNIPDSLDS